MVQCWGFATPLPTHKRSHIPRQRISVPSGRTKRLRPPGPVTHATAGPPPPQPGADQHGRRDPSSEQHSSLTSPVAPPGRSASPLGRWDPAEGMTGPVAPARGKLCSSPQRSAHQEARPGRTAPAAAPPSGRRGTGRSGRRRFLRAGGRSPPRRPPRFAPPRRPVPVTPDAVEQLHEGEGEIEAEEEEEVAGGLVRQDGPAHGAHSGSHGGKQRRKAGPARRAAQPLSASAFPSPSAGGRPRPRPRYARPPSRLGPLT